ncbi:hypothetical protein RYH80_13765 [Halobaculum sp. MBLA0147]|uniref:outer membrane protein assembly factor BamB family protein n=1 Tax=Halobaculum sp. MBLA0147 TaxID=3079934 RepID=UPI003525007C
MRRRALLRAGGLAGLASLAGCTGLLGGAAPDGGGTPTVNPALDGSPTPQDGVAWSVAAPDLDRLYTDGAGHFVLASATDGRYRHRAVDARTGERVWAFDLPDDRFVSPRGGVLVADSGFGDETDTVRVFDPENGTELWRRERSTHVETVVEGTVVLVPSRDETPEEPVVVGVDARSGEESWRLREPREVVWRAEATATVVTLADASAPRAPLSAAATETRSATPKTDSTATEPETTSSATPTGTETGFGEDGETELRARDPRTGRLLWATRLPDGTTDARVTAPTAETLLVWGGDRVVVVDAETGRVRGRGTVPAQVDGYGGHVADGHLVTGDWEYRDATEPPATVVFLSLADAAVRTVTTPAVREAAVGGAVADRGVVTTVGRPGEATVVCRDTDGDERWRRSGVALAATEAGPVLGIDGAVLAVDWDGTERWRDDLPFDEPFRTYTAAPERVEGVFVYAADERVVAHAETGVVSWTLTDGTRRTLVTGLTPADREDAHRRWTTDVAAATLGDRLVGIPL